MTAISDAGLVRLWDDGRDQDPPERTLGLLRLARPNLREEDLAALSLGERNRHLIRLMCDTFGDDVMTIYACPRCELDLEVEVSRPELISACVDDSPIEFESDCPECESTFLHPWDVVGHIWGVVTARVKRLTYEVHTLVMAYGWTEAEILSMSGSARRRYLDLID